jgi:TatA/E family protein of Tat protein translocase
MGALSPVHLIIILVIALLILGPGKLPETGAAVGHAIREFRHAMDGKDDAAPLAGGPVAAAPPAQTAAEPVAAAPLPQATGGPVVATPPQVAPAASDAAGTADSTGRGPA